MGNDVTVTENKSSGLAVAANIDPFIQFADAVSPKHILGALF